MYADLENATESGVLYLVPDKNGKGKRVVRRPRPPPTSPPLDDDFDAYTMETREPVTEPGTIKGRTSWAPTSSPLDENFDAWTYTNTAGPITGTGTIYEEREYDGDSEEEEEKEHRQEQDEEPRDVRSNWLHGGSQVGERMVPRNGAKGQSSSPRAGESDAYHRERRENAGFSANGGYEHSGPLTSRHNTSGENGKHRDRTESNGNRADPIRSPRPEPTRGSGSVQGRSRMIRSRSGASTTQNGHGHHRAKPASGKELRPSLVRARNDFSHQTVSRRGPAAQDYEVVDSHVLEEGPERTVTISTWREKVANEARRSQVEMSVYYLSADDYVMGTEVDTREHFGAASNGYTNRKGKQKARDTLPLANGWSRSKPPHYDDNASLRAYTPWPSGTNLADMTQQMSARSQHEPREDATRASDSHADWWREETVTGRTYGQHRTSTPVQRRRNGIHPEPIPAFPPSQRQHVNGKGSDSTISSMKVASTQALEVLLTSCEPPLIYLAPILMALGIRTQEHLKAVARLTEETRNKEVREEALKRGMTVMEWAILLDKLQQNG